MTDKLSIFNGALRVLKERRLSSLSEAREPRRLLDDVWDNDGVKTCLQMSQFNFAISSNQFDYDPSITPPFGYRYVMAKPSDFVRTAGVCTDEYFRSPLTNYFDNAGYWVSDFQTLYIRYVSSANDFGMDYSKWPYNFTRMVEAWFATQIKSIAPDEVGDRAEMIFKEWERKAKMTDAMESPAQFPPIGGWVRARRSQSRDRTPSGSLY